MKAELGFGQKMMNWRAVYRLPRTCIWEGWQKSSASLESTHLGSGALWPATLWLTRGGYRQLSDKVSNACDLDQGPTGSLLSPLTHHSIPPLPRLCRCERNAWCLSQGFTAVNRHHDQGKSYKGQHLVETDLYVLRFRQGGIMAVSIQALYRRS